MDISLLNKNGWILVDGISSTADFLKLANEVGSPVRAPNGEIIKKIRRKSKEIAYEESQSAIYGNGRFPLHTDTVFWPLPAKFILFRAYGDVRRPTTIKYFGDFLDELGEYFNIIADRSVWYVGPKSNRIHCSIRFKAGGSIAWRYDADLMTPANDAAHEVNRILKPLVFSEDVYNIPWSGSNAVIISNWMTLHGRGPQPENEGDRVIERIYVR